MYFLQWLWIPIHLPTVLSTAAGGFCQTDSASLSSFWTACGSRVLRGDVYLGLALVGRAGVRP